jgi:hypothetical protein
MLAENYTENATLPPSSTLELRGMHRVGDVSSTQVVHGSRVSPGVQSCHQAKETARQGRESIRVMILYQVALIAA